MGRSVSLSLLSSVSEKEKAELLSGLVAGARQPANGYVEELDAEIAEYERRYELPSEELLEELDSGQREETDDIASWLMLISLRKRVAADQPR